MSKCNFSTFKHSAKHSFIVFEYYIILNIKVYGVQK